MRRNRSAAIATGRLLLAVIALTLLLPAAARSQTPMDGPFRNARTWYVGAGAFAAVSSGAGGSAVVRLGETLGDHLLVGLEGGILVYGGESDYEHQYVDAVVTLYPSADAGGFVKAGFGYGVTHEERPNLLDTSDEHGPDARLSAGWDWVVGRRHFGKDLLFGVEGGIATHPGVKHGDFMLLLTLGLY